MQSLFNPAPGDPGFLAGTLGLAMVPFGASNFVRKMPDWIIPTRERANAIRMIGQTEVSTLDPASFQTAEVSPKERGLPAAIDYRQPQVAVGLGAMDAQNSATDQSLGYLLGVMELVAFNAGLPIATVGGLNVKTILGHATYTNEEAEVTDTDTNLPWDASGDPWTSADADALGLIQEMIAAYVARHGVRPNVLWITSTALHALAGNTSIMSLVDGPLNVLDVLNRLAGQGFSTIHIGLPGRGMLAGTMLMARQEGPVGGRPQDAYQPIAICATDQIDSKGEDYAMGASATYSAPPLASAIGYRWAKAKWGSIEESRAACNFDVDINYRGFARALEVLG